MFTTRIHPLEEPCIAWRGDRYLQFGIVREILSKNILRAANIPRIVACGYYWPKIKAVFDPHASKLNVFVSIGIVDILRLEGSTIISSRAISFVASMAAVSVADRTVDQARLSAPLTTSSRICDVDHLKIQAQGTLARGEIVALPFLSNNRSTTKNATVRYSEIPGERHAINLYRRALASTCHLWVAQGKNKINQLTGLKAR
jgi:hypothetical protein